MTARPDQLRAWDAATRYALHERQGCAAAVMRVMRGCSIKHPKVTPSVAGMARSTGYSERQVIRATGWLERRGRLTITRRAPHCRRDGSWARSQTNLYSIRWPGRDTPKTARRPWSHRHDMDVTSMHSEAIETPPVAAAGQSCGADPPPPPAEAHDPPGPRLTLAEAKALRDAATAETRAELAATDAGISG